MTTVFQPYRTDFPSDAALAVAAIIRGTSTLSLSEKANALFAILDYALGQALPVQGNSTVQPHAAALMKPEDVALFLEAHSRRTAEQRATMSINWVPIILAVLQAILQALQSSGA